jgi:amino acid adenylation domain-containing protein
VARLTGRKEVVFGTVLFGRMQGGSAADRVLGMFINTLPLRVDIGTTGMAQGIRDVHTTLTGLMRHEHASLALAQRCSGVAAPTPLFSSLLNYRHVQIAETADADGAATSAWEGIGEVAGMERTNYPLTLSIDDMGQDFALTAQVDGRVENGAAHVCRYMHTALQQLVQVLETTANISGPLAILPPAEREQITFGWNATFADYPQNQTLPQLFEAQVAKTPHALALSFEGAHLSYHELNARANRLAHYLRGQGAGADAAVGICMDRSFDMVTGLLGILKAGAAYVPFDPGYPVQRLAYMLDDAQPVVMLTESRLLERVQRDAMPALCLDREFASLANYPETNPEPISGPGNLAYLIYTSGSTGRPKGVGIEQAGIVNRLLWMQEAYRLNEQDKVLQKTPYSFDVSVWEFFWPLITGACLVVAKPGGHQDPAYLAALINSEAITTLHFVPPMLDAFLAALPGTQYPSLRQVMCSGQALPRDLQQRFHQQLPATQLHNLYGPTEASVDVTAWQCREDDATISVPIGQPIANIQIHILDENLDVVPAGVAGELHIAGIGLARGYLNRGELTAEKFVPNPFSREPGARMYKSGDLARYRADGNIEYLGRIDHQVKIRGFRIELGEIEAALTALPAVREAVVLARDDGPGGQRLAAYLVLHEGSATEAFDPASLRQALLQSLPEYMVPAYFMQITHLPLTSSGKLDRKSLPAPETVQRDIEHVAASTPSELAVAKIWMDVMKIKSVGIHDNFFDLGGHSLLAIQVLSQISRETSINIPLDVVFKSQTVFQIARYIDGIKLVREASSEVDEVPEGSSRIWI